MLFFSQLLRKDKTVMNMLSLLSDHLVVPSYHGINNRLRMRIPANVNTHTG